MKEFDTFHNVVQLANFWKSGITDSDPQVGYIYDANNGILTLYGTTTENTYLRLCNMIADGTGFAYTHDIIFVKYEVLENPFGIPTKYGWQNQTDASTSIISTTGVAYGRWQRNPSVGTGTGLSSMSPGIKNMNGFKCRIQEFDLTQMYGSGNEPSLEDCKLIFGLPHFPLRRKR